MGTRRTFEGFSFSKNLRGSHESASFLQPVSMFRRPIVCLLSAFVFFLAGTWETVGVGQISIDVTNTNTSGSGSLPYAIDQTNSNSGGTVNFSFPSASTISLTSNSTISQSVDFENTGAAANTVVQLNANYFWISDTAGSISVGSGVIIENTDGSWGVLTNTSGTITLGNIAGTISAVGSGVSGVQAKYVAGGSITGLISSQNKGLYTHATGIYGAGDTGIGTCVAIDGIGSTGTVSATSVWSAYGVSSNSALTVNSGIDGTIVADGQIEAYGLYAYSGITINGGIGSAGLISATSGSGTAYAIYSYGTDTLAINGGIAGSVVASGSGTTAGILNRSGNVTIDAISGDVIAASSAADATGIFAGGSLTINGITSTGSVSAIGSSTSYAIRGTSNVVINNGIAGAVNAESETDIACAICSGNSSTSGSLTINGGIASTAFISATSGSSSAYGIFATSDVTINGDVAGTVFAGGSATSAAISSGNGSVVADAITGTVSAQSSAAIANAISAGGSISINGIGSAGVISATGASTTYGIHATSDVIINNGIAGAVTAESESSSAYGINSSSTATISGGIASTGTVSATSGSGSAYAIDGVSQVSITGDIAGTVIASGSMTAIAIMSDSGDVTTGAISGTVYGTSTGGTAAGILAQSGSVSVGSITGNVSAKGGSGDSYGIAAGSVATIAGIGSTGSVSATSGSGSAYAIDGVSNVSISGDIAGTILASGSTTAVAIFSASGDVTTDAISGVVYGTSTAGTAAGILAQSGSVSVGSITGNVSAKSGSGDSYGIVAGSSVTIAGIGSTGTVSAASNSARAYAVFSSSSVSINGDIAGLVSAAGSSYAVGIQGSSVAINGDIPSTGTISAIATDSGSQAIAIRAGNNGVSISGTIAGAVIAQADQSATGIETSGSFSCASIAGLVKGVSAASRAQGIEAWGALNIGSIASTGTVSAISIYDESRAIWCYRDVTIGDIDGMVISQGSNSLGISSVIGTVQIDSLAGSVISQSDVWYAAGIIGSTVSINSISGLIATECLSGSAAVGIYGSSVSLGEISSTGTISASGNSELTVAVGGNSVAINNMAGTIYASGATNIAAGIFTDSGNISVGTVSGEILATASTGSAYGIWSATNTINGGNDSTTTLIQGTVAASSSGTASDVGAYAVAGQGITLKVAEGAALSATSASGQAYAIYDNGSTRDNVELVAGCNITGSIRLSDSTSDTLTLSAGTSGNSTTIAGGVSGAESVAVTGGDWAIAGALTGVNELSLSGGSLFVASGDMSANISVATGGSLSFNGVTTGSATVYAGSFLGGTGTFGELTNYGTLSPGNSIGTIHVAGNYVNAAGSNVNIQINPAGDCDKIIVSGVATLQGGTVNVLGGSGSYASGTKYVFLTAGTVEGTYAGVTDDLAFLNVSLVYGSDFVEILLRSSANYDDVAATPNQHGVARYLDANKSSATGDFATVLNGLNSLNGVEARQAYDAMSGELYGSLATVGIEAHEQFLRAISQRLQSQSMTRGFDDFAASNRLEDNLRYCSRTASDSAMSAGWITWAQGYGVGSNLASDGNASGLNYSTGGMLVGAERLFGGDTKVGLVGGYSSTNVALDARGDNGSIDGGQMAVYLHRDFEQSYMTGIAAYGYSSYATTRYIDFASIDRTAHANYGGNNYSFYTEAGHTVYGRYVHLQPYAGLEYIQVHQNDFTETGADSIDIATGGEQAAAFRGMLGTRVFSNFHTDSGRLLTLEGRAAWRHEFLDESRILDASFAGVSGSSFAIAGENVDRDAAIVGLGATYQIRTGFSVFTSYDLSVSQNYTAHAGAGGVQYQW